MHLPKDASKHLNLCNSRGRSGMGSLRKDCFKPEILKTAGRTDNQIEYGDMQNHYLGKKSISSPYITDISASKNA